MKNILINNPLKQISIFFLLLPFVSSFYIKSIGHFDIYYYLKFLEFILSIVIIDIFFGKMLFYRIFFTSSLLIIYILFALFFYYNYFIDLINYLKTHGLLFKIRIRYILIIINLILVLIFFKYSRSVKKIFYPINIFSLCRLLLF